MNLHDINSSLDIVFPPKYLLKFAIWIFLIVAPFQELVQAPGATVRGNTLFQIYFPAFLDTKCSMGIQIKSSWTWNLSKRQQLNQLPDH